MSPGADFLIQITNQISYICRWWALAEIFRKLWRIKFSDMVKRDDVISDAINTFVHRIGHIPIVHLHIRSNDDISNHFRFIVKNELISFIHETRMMSRRPREKVVKTTVTHYCDVIMGTMASQIASLTSVYSTVFFMRRSKKISQLRVTGLFVGNSPVTDEFPAQMASNAENVSIWWRHHDQWTGLGFALGLG